MWVRTPLVNFSLIFLNPEDVKHICMSLFWILGKMLLRQCFLFPPVIIHIFFPVCSNLFWMAPMRLGYCSCPCFGWRQRVLNPESAGCSWSLLVPPRLEESPSAFARQSFQGLLPGIALLDSDGFMFSSLDGVHRSLRCIAGLLRGSFPFHPCPQRFDVALSSQRSMANTEYSVLGLFVFFWPRITQKGGNETMGGGRGTPIVMP